MSDETTTTTTTTRYSTTKSNHVKCYENESEETIDFDDIELIKIKMDKSNSEHCINENIINDYIERVYDKVSNQENINKKDNRFFFEIV
jgi:hypothetical protein